AKRQPGSASMVNRSPPVRPASPWPGRDRAVFEKPAASAVRSVTLRHEPTMEERDMFKSLAISQIYVLDQKAALDFYVGKLGLEVNTDQDLGFMRWLTVS